MDSNALGTVNGPHPRPVPEGEGAATRRSIGRRLADHLPAVACFAIAFVFAFTRAITEKIYSDEQLFLGGAGLMARGEGLIYRDFFYNHMPTHALVLAAIFKCTVHWTLAARTFDALCAAGIVALLFEAARRSFIRTTAPWRIVLAAGISAIFLFNPVTADAVGKAWNHDLAAFACLLGFLLLSRGLQSERPAWWVIAAGACAAIAVTSRLTFAPPLIAFPLSILLAPARAARDRFKLLCLFTIGGLIAAAPTLWVFLHAPASAYFENVKFPGLTTRYQGELQRGARDTILRKFDFISRVGAKSWSLTLFFWLSVAVLLAAVRPLRVRTSFVHARFVCVAVLTLAASLAAFVPTPMYHQYLYGPAPFAALMIAWGIASLGLERFIWSRLALIALCVICVTGGRDEYAGVSTIASPSKWTPNLLHKDGKRLARLAGPGKVLTFMPGLALEAGLPIYKGLSIGRYATRIADYLTPEQRARMNVPNLSEIRRWFDVDPPGAVLLVDPDSPLELPIEAIAKEHGYVAQDFGSDHGDARVLMLPPR